MREVRTRCGIGRDGITADVLARTARSYGLTVRALVHRAKPERPAAARHRALELLSLRRHRALRPGRIDIVDPACGRVRLTPEEFDAAFTGVVLTFQPGPEFANRTQPAAAS